MTERARHILLQAALCGVLASMLGLAALVQRHFAHAQRIRFSDEEMVLAGFRLKIPRGWSEGQDEHGIVLQEAGTHASRRRIEIWRDPLVAFASPIEYLARSPDRRIQEVATILAHARDESSIGVKPLTIANWPGFIISHTRLLWVNELRRALPSKQIVASTILPSGEAVLLRLVGEGFATAQDEMLLSQVAQALRINAAPRLRRGGTAYLDGGLALTIPRSLVRLHSADPMSISARFLSRDFGSWLGVDLVPCLLTRDEPAAELLELIRARDPFFHPDQVTKLDDHTWLARRSADDRFPGAIFVRSSEDGRALLADFRWTGARQQGEDRARSLWAEISAALQFKSGDDLRQMVHFGTQAAAQVRADVWKLLSGEPRQQLWEWYDERLPRSWRMSVEYLATSEGIQSIQKMRSAQPGEESGSTWQWKLSGDGAAYELDITPSASAAQHLKSRLADGQLNLSRHIGAEPPRTSASRIRENFIPGAAFPLIIGRLPREPLVLQTDVILAPGTHPSTSPMTLVLRPERDHQRWLLSPRRPLYCCSVIVNGSSMCSRWYFDEQGLLHSVQYPGGIHLRRLEGDDAETEAESAPASRPVQPHTRPGSAAGLPPVELSDHGQSR